MKRIIPLTSGEIYHIVSRSIAQYKVFNNTKDYLRFEQLLKYYQKRPEQSFSYFMSLDAVTEIGFNNNLAAVTKDVDEIVQIIAYCLMPTHIHLILCQLRDGGISKYLGNILNSYTRYFNFQHQRKGPLWEERFKNILVKDDEQLLHLTRYIHLNPVTALLANKPEKWPHSSYREYIQTSPQTITNFKDVLDIVPSDYRKFVNDRISYQRELAKIKTLILD